MLRCWLFGFIQNRRKDAIIIARSGPIQNKTLMYLLIVRPVNRFSNLAEVQRIPRYGPIQNKNLKVTPPPQSPQKKKKILDGAACQ